jgi:Fe(3+) dicitrate transport protein
VPADTTITVKELDAVTVRTVRIPHDILRLEPVRGTYVFSGKKSEVIDLTQRPAALTEKYGRQIFAKIPGVFVYDMDGTGNQVNISTRSLDPHRGWEFNIRKDGVLTNSDMYGYPASHYNIPMEAVQRIELIRGTGSLQYGAQFGGMLNYVSKQPDTTRPLAFESINTIGSYGLVSTYNGASGTTGKLAYSGWFNKKWLGGYRDYSASEYDAEGITLQYEVSSALRLRAEWTHSNYVTQLPGPLTDSMFMADPQQATRQRNYYSPDIHVPSIHATWTPNPRFELEFTSSAVLGTRSSVMFDRPATIPDAIDPITLEPANRQVDIDNFNSYTTEVRARQRYTLLRKASTITGGIQWMNNDLHRRQQGVGTTGDDYDLTLVVPGWGRDLHSRTHNLAVFAENHWRPLDRLSVNAGVRYELGDTEISGETRYAADSLIRRKLERSFPLFGASVQYDLSDDINLYGGWSQAYRPVVFRDQVPASIYETVDPDMKDATGYNAEVGFRGRWRFLRWDVTGFVLQYNDRPGALASTDAQGNYTVLRTNIGDSRTMGLELFLQGNILAGRDFLLSIFTATSWMDAHYTDAWVRSGTENISIADNKVESAPNWISRNGVAMTYRIARLSLQYSYTGESYADPMNTATPDATGAVGLVPGYGLVDAHLALQVSPHLTLQLNASNVLDASYFTKRPQFYPGPGIWPSDGRTFSLTVAARL